MKLTQTNSCAKHNKHTTTTTTTNNNKIVTAAHLHALVRPLFAGGVPGAVL